MNIRKRNIQAKSNSYYLDKDTLIDGKYYKKGHKMMRVSGIECPKCKTFYAGSTNIHICNACGYKKFEKKKMKPHEIKKHIKKLKRKQKMEAQIANAR